MKAGWTSWNYCVAIKAAWNWAHREGLIQDNPLSRYPNPPQPKADVSEATLITEAEVEWFLDKSEPYGARPILEVLHATGARPGELCSAKVGDYTKKSKQLRLLNWKNGRKTNVARIIPLPTDAAAMVAKLCDGKKGDDPIFTGPNKAPWNPNRLQKIWRKIREGKWRALKGKNFEQISKDEAAKRQKKTAQREMLSLYDFRHLWISDALQQGVPIAQIAKLAGTSIKMIERTYGHFRNDDLNKIANQIADRRKRK
jgi:integrase